MVYENEIKRDPASFRDPAANVYASEGKVVRLIYKSYFPEYDQFMDRVYPILIEKGLIVPHRVMSRDEDRIVIAPEYIELITYPYEWTFAMLKEAALVTLLVNQIALEQGMMLKDASAYNIQYSRGRMRLIDTTSFMFYNGATPWPAYSQFLRHFVCPMLWIKYYNPKLSRLSEIYLDGIPVPLTSRMLPIHTRLSARLWRHIFAQSLDFQPGPWAVDIKMSRFNLIAFLNDLFKFVSRLEYKLISGHGWLKYAEAGSYTPDSLRSKKEIVYDCIDRIRGKRIMDIGANTGDYSHMAAAKGWDVIALDADHDCMFCLAGVNNILPLVVDLCNPSPAIGWDNQERHAIWDRIGKVDAVMALALIHHLSVRNNVPLGLVAELLAHHCNNLIIEWVPLEDRQAQKLLGTKCIPEYSQQVFLNEFSRLFHIGRSFPITGSERIIYEMEVK